MDKQILKNRIVYFDILRTIGCLLVILYHASGNYAVSVGAGYQYWIKMLFNAIARIGVPLFCMISGALLLDENREFTFEKMKTHIWRITRFFLFWLAVYALAFKIVLPALHGDEITLRGIASTFSSDAYHLWFCLMIIGLYLVTPLLKLWVKRANVRYVRYFLLLSFIFHFLQRYGHYLYAIYQMPNLFLMFEKVELHYVTGFVFYFILGWYLHNYELDHQKTAIVICGVVGYLLTFFGEYIVSTFCGQSMAAQHDLNPNIMLLATAVFLLVKTGAARMDFEKHRTLLNIFRFASERSFGIYGVHQIMLYLASVVTYNIFGISGAFFAIVLVSSMTFVSSYCVSLVFGYLPLLRKVV